LTIRLLNHCQIFGSRLLLEYISFSYSICRYITTEFNNIDIIQEIAKIIASSLSYKSRRIEDSNTRIIANGYFRFNKNRFKVLSGSKEEISLITRY
jgi:hypothetical protein